MTRQSLRITEPQFRQLANHLFPGDGDEHGAVVLAGIAESDRETRFLAREVIIARDGIDYVPGSRGYRALSGQFVASISDRCAREKLCYLAVHCHGGSDHVAFSGDDLASHQRGYPALLDITNDGPVGAMVFANNAAAGEIWRRSGTSALDEVTVIGPNIRHIYPSPPSAAGHRPMYHRQSMLFGARGQEALRRAKVGIIGLGGAGSLVSQWLAHLGVGHIVGVDFDRLEPTNRPRVVGATGWDAGEPFVRSNWRVLQALGRRLAKYKVDVAARVARSASPAVCFDAIVGDIRDELTALLLTDVDYLFLCADGMLPRLVFNVLVHQYLIPGVQIGAKVPVDRRTGTVGDPFSVARRILPYAGGGCLHCNGLIPPAKLEEEAVEETERKARAYVEDDAVKAPSVITMNALAAAQAANDFLYSFQGLVREEVFAGHLMHFARERRWEPTDLTARKDCIQCGSSTVSFFARGDRVRLPCRTGH